MYHRTKALLQTEGSNLGLPRNTGRSTRFSHNASDLTRTSARGEDLPVAPRSGFGCSRGRLGRQTASLAPTVKQPHGLGVGGDVCPEAPSLTQQYRPKNSQLPRKPDLEYYRAALASCERVLRVAREVRAEQSAAGMDLRSRIAWASVIQDCEGWVAGARRRLRKAERAAKGVRHGS